MTAMQFNFEWDARKAATNIAKHGVAFEAGCTVFRDPRALSVFDVEHNENEDRWLTLDLSSTGALLVVHHTFLQVDEKAAAVRILSVRRATKRERQQYMEQIP